MNSPQGFRAVKKRLADGTTKTYYYPRKGGAEPPEKYEAETVGALLIAYQRSPEWLAKKPLRAWTAAEADHAQAMLPEHLRRVVVLARYTAQRRGDLIALRWSDYDNGALRLRQEKTGAELRIPVLSALRAELGAWKACAQSVFILTNVRGRPWRAEHLSHEMRKGLARIGLPDDLNVHGLRKLGAASLAEAGCSTHEIAAITGHKTLGMVQFYTASADRERLATAAVVKMERRK